MTPMTTDPSPAPARGATMLRGLALDVALPVGVYYLLHLLGAPDWPALLAASAVAAARVAWSAVRTRTLNPFASVMLVVYGIGFLLALVTGDPRTLLLRTSLITGAVGVVFLLTAIRGQRPLTLAAMQSFAPARAEAAEREYATAAAARRGHRISSAVWGIGLIAEALLRLPLVYLLPVSVAVGLTEGMAIVVLAGLAAWNVWYARRLRSRQPDG